MCGVIACRTSEPAIDYLIAALRRLEYRGYDSVGVAVRTVTGDIATVRTVGRVGALDKRVREWAGPAFGSVGIGHTRWATHGTVTEDNAHPHVDCTGRICVVHNGIIENADTLRTALTTSGHVFTSSVDSEVICHLVEEQLQLGGDLVEAVEDALAVLEGSWALAVLEKDTGQLVVAANHSPLLVAHTVLGDFATSDIAAIADWTDRFRVLHDGDVVDLSGSGRWRNHGVDVVPQALTPCLMRGNDVDLAGYSDYMAKEIDEQPEAVARVLDELGRGIADGKLWSDLGLMPFDRMQVIGCGTSLNAGTVVANFVRTVGGFPVMTTVGSEADDALLEPHTLTVAFSQSGETADVLHALKSRGASQPPVLAITNSAHSTLARRAEAVVTCAAGPEIGVAATKTFVCQIVAGVAVMISALVARRRLSEHAAGQLVDDLRRLPEQLAAACATAKYVVPSLIDGLMTASGFIFIARGAGLPYAAEGALKLKELTYQWAEHYPAGELKHGPLALVGTSTPVVVIESADRKLAGNVAEVMARGGQIISIGGPESTLPVVDDLLSLWGPLAAAVPLQILARQLALALGRDVDKPRNLAKSVTVE
ncbi:glutamine amidotransferase [Mycobacterium sp. ST-F2]|uniref:glutamine--fructose-6-phosphate transaminase (isomerizing) n=1 Tax=Mycobacterium sp. ST-F2 TaxID=1490484 RepID=UPI0009388C64|nr:glutamine--fructose-6-phosphate transaminase (isomerizing) [Mycobacterium sp. ST-F2]OKH79454.1 glutamine amidotransferase [Mycobacterium sp. ST-F2]